MLLSKAWCSPFLWIIVSLTSFSNIHCSIPHILASKATNWRTYVRLKKTIDIGKRDRTDKRAVGRKAFGPKANFFIPSIQTNVGGLLPAIRGDMDAAHDAWRFHQILPTAFEENLALYVDYAGDGDTVTRLSETGEAESVSWWCMKSSFPDIPDISRREEVGISERAINGLSPGMVPNRFSTFMCLKRNRTREIARCFTLKTFKYFAVAPGRICWQKELKYRNQKKENDEITDLFRTALADARMAVPGRL